MIRTFLLLLALSAVEGFAKGIPDGWKAVTFSKSPRETVYTQLKTDDGQTYIMAESSAAASGLAQAATPDLDKTPRLVWSWKIDHVLERADARKKEGDDYAARVYVGFKTWWFKRTALIYIWDNALPVGTVLDSPYTSGAKMIVVESGAAKAGRWIPEYRNVLEDYRRAFGKAPPKPEFIAIMTDTDQTGESALAWYKVLGFQP